MHARLFIVALALAVGSGAQAQPMGAPREGGPPPREGGPGHPHGGRLFISPSGEPFRGGAGLDAWFARVDADHDGTISRAEFKADAMASFQVLDENHDGKIDGFEIQDYEHNIVPEITAFSFGAGDGPRSRSDGGGGHRGGGRHGGGGRGGGPGFAGMPGGGGLQGAARFSLLNEPQPLSGADLDVDGRVTLDEWTRATSRRFDQLDTTHAGALTKATLPPLPGQPGPGKPKAG
jgi:hypothetical protein